MIECTQVVIATESTQCVPTGTLRGRAAVALMTGCEAPLIRPLRDTETGENREVEAHPETPSG